LIKLLKTLATYGTSRSAASDKSRQASAARKPISAGHGLDRQFSQPIAPATLPPDWRGRLKNGNRPGDFLAAPRCGTRLTGSSAGHGVLRPKSDSPVGAPPCGRPRRGANGRPHGAAPTAASGMTAEKIHHRGHRDHRDAPPSLVRAAHLSPSSVVSVSSVVNPSSAGHGVLRPKSDSPIGAPPCGRPRRGANGRPHGAAPTAASIPSSAGHGVHRSNSTAASGMTAEKIHHRGHRDRRDAPPSLVRAAHLSASSVVSVSSVVNPSSAGHGLHCPLLTRGLSTSIHVHLRSSAASIPFSAGHGLHRSNFDSRPALR